MRRAVVTFKERRQGVPADTDRGVVVTAEVADTPEAQARGLMFRDALGEQEAMLFPFPVSKRYGFWMKNVRIPLDIIWIERGRVVWIVESAPPCTADPCPTYVSEAKASTVLEVKGGFVSRHGIAIGDAVRVEPGA